jgi:DNA-binding transcriptional ArsR family regulator
MAEVLDRQTIKALSADSRQAIMKMLTKRPYTASEIAKITKKHVTTVTEHLDSLERASLVKKKPGKKWVYYELSEKGEHLFKPQFYSWVVVLSLSAVLMFVGLLRLTNFAYIGRDMMTAQESAPMLTQIAEKTADANIYATGTPVDYIAYSLIVLGIAGLVYLAYRRLK